jgi:hypothetical protein
LIEAVNPLPDEAVSELASFVEYLRYKALQPQNSEPPKQNFLLTIAGLGKSDQSNTSDSDEEILRNEIDRIPLIKAIASLLMQTFESKCR